VERESEASPQNPTATPHEQERKKTGETGYVRVNSQVPYNLNHIDHQLATTNHQLPTSNYR